MKVVKKFQSALVALLLVFWAGCTSVPDGSVQLAILAAQKPAVSKPAITPPATSMSAPQVSVPTTRSVLGLFPTSSVKPMGKPWGVMHPEGFTGGYTVAGKLLGLSDAQVKKYNDMHSAGVCTVMDVPNGVVLDRLTFTRNGKHQVQNSVKVDLKDPPSRKVEVCDLGDGVIAMRFHGCNNHALVRDWNHPLKRTVTVPGLVPSQTQCKLREWLEVIIWEEKAKELPGVAQTIANENRSGVDYFATDSLSRTHGPQFREEKKAGRLNYSAEGHELIVNHIRHDGRVTEIFRGVVVGRQLIRLPGDFSEGDVIQEVYPNLAKLASPPKDKRSAWKEYQSCINSSHSIGKK